MCFSDVDHERRTAVKPLYYPTSERFFWKFVMRLGLFGGSFNPVHIAHLLQARDVLEQFGLDRIDFVVSAKPPHKLDRLEQLAAGEHRVAMLKLAVSGHPEFSVSRVELDREGPSYTIDTVQWYRKNHEGAELFWILGSDNLPELHQWKDAERLFQFCHIIVVQRPGFERVEMTPENLHFPQPICDALQEGRVSVRVLDVNSTEIRKRVLQDQDISWLVPEQVARYIEDNGLYQNLSGGN
jgi:nicotinate-nucleotide adenylyltransferase